MLQIKTQSQTADKLMVSSEEPNIETYAGGAVSFCLRGSGKKAWQVLTDTETLWKAIIKHANFFYSKTGEPGRDPDVEILLREALKRAGQSWISAHRFLSDQQRVELLGALLAQEQIAERRRQQCRQDEETNDEPYVGDPDIMETNTSLGHTVGGGKRNIRGRKSLGGN